MDNFDFLVINMTNINDNKFNDYIESISTAGIYDSLHCKYCNEDEFNSLCDQLKSTNIDLSVFHLNIRSLNANQSGLIQLLTLINLKFDVIALSEIWSYNMQFYQNLLDNYTLFYDLPHTSNVGGIGVYVLKNLKVKLLPNLDLKVSSSNVIENVWLEIIKNDITYNIGSIYRHPGQSITEFSNSLDNTIKKICNKKVRTIVLGDLNIDVLKVTEHKDTANYVDQLLTRNLLPVSMLPSRITSRSTTLIDHVYFCEGKVKSSDNLNIYCGNIVCDVTDHFANYFILYNKAAKVDYGNRPLTRLFTAKNKMDFRNEISKVSWKNSVLQQKDPTLALSVFMNELTSCYEKSFPSVRVSRRGFKDKKWITAALKKSSRQKNTLYRKWLQTRSAQDELKYKQYKKIFSKTAKQAESDYYKTLFNKNASNAKLLWKNINSLCSFAKKQNKTSYLSKLIINKNEISHPDEIAQELNQYFTTVGTNLAKNVKPANGDYTQYMKTSLMSSFYCQDITTDEIIKQLLDIKRKKKATLDSLNLDVLASVSHIIALPLQHIYNSSLDVGIFPDSLKVAQIVPIFKKKG